MKKPVDLRFVLVLLSVFALLCPLYAASGSGWVPEWAEQLGLKLEKSPAPTDAFSEIKATVEDPSKLGELGLSDLTAGEAVVIKYAGNVGWKAQVGDAEIKPCLVRISTETGKTVTLSPERKSLKLKSSPPPYRGSLAKDPNG